MKKRIVCALLTLIMLVSLVPATVITASAATMNISEAAITVLKQAEGYSTKCDSKGYTGYGTLCPEEGPHDGAHKTTEKESDLALRKALKPLDEAVSNFASRNGIALSQNKHDALVLFSFENGTAWTTGTGDLQAAIKSGKTDNEFLNAICWWDEHENDDNRRMIEANMYLNGVYSSKAPDRFIRVVFDANGGSMSEARYQYFDVLKDKSINIVPSNNYNKFLGWYNYKTKGKQITSVTKDMDNTTLYAHWQDNSADPGANNAYYKISASKLASRVIYKEPNGKKADLPNASGTIRIDSEYLDKNGTRWGRMVEERTDPNNTNSIYTEFVGWVKLEVGASNSTSASTGATMDVTVTVTNAYVNMRSNASITSKNVGRWEQGAQLRIINKVNGKDGFVWGQVAKSATDSTPVGWVALMYTNYDAASSQNTVSSSTATVVGTATITYNGGYVNVRNAAGTDNQIVGALPNGTTVELYETKYVNGIQWGRCKTGWFCLAYADVDALVEGKDVADVGFTTYTFKGKLLDPMHVNVYKKPGTDAEKVKIKDEDRKKLSTVTITNLTADDYGNTWGKFSKGWVIVTDGNGEPVDVDLNTAKFTVIAETANVRSDPSTDAARKDILVKGVEFNVNAKKQVRVVDETIWGYATKVGENSKSYKGWVNLANKNVSRDGSVLAEKLPTTSGKIATVVGTDTVKVRATGATYGKILGSLNRGTSAAVLAEKDGWYNLDIDVDGNAKTGSWVYGKYLEITEGDSAGASGTTGAGGAVSTGMGIVANTYSGVNVRTGAGTAYAAVGKLLPGTAVEIKQVKTVGASKWGRTEKGWVCMDYITMVSNYEVMDSNTGSTAGGNTATGTTTSEVAIYTGIVKNATTVYKTTSKDSDVVRELSDGASITMHEIVTHVEYDDKSISHDNEGETVEMKTTYWARVNDGYIYSPGDCIVLDTIDEQIYTVTGADTLNVREGAGTSFAKKDFNLEKGDQVAVTRLKIDKGSVWGFFERDDNTDGWICLTNYTTKGAVSVSDNAPQQSTQTTPPAVTPPVIGSTGNTTTGGFVNNTSGYKYTGKIINDNEVNIRATASLNAAKTTTLKNGAALVIYETTISEGMAWGRCDAGWVYLYYVDLTPVNGAVDARVVFNENTVIYTDMNCTSTTGFTYAKMAVIDIYEIVGKMARTNDGWVNTDNLL